MLAALAEGQSRIGGLLEGEDVLATGKALRAMGIARSRIAVAALNPHAGEGGLFGRQDIEVSQPTIAKAVDDNLKAAFVVQNTDSFSPFSPTVLRRVEAVPGVTETSPVRFGLARVNGVKGNQAVSGITAVSNNTAYSVVAASLPSTLAAGTNKVALQCPTDTSCNVNIDTVAVMMPATALAAPHAPLGGYRRGLDGVEPEWTGKQAGPGREAGLG